MECLFASELEPGEDVYELTEPAELRHLRALRLRPGESIALTNGRGTLVLAEFCGENPERSAAVFRILRELPPNELPAPVGIALGILHERERLEFAVEKAVELGVREISLLRTRYTQPVTVRLARLEAKIRAAVKQAHRAWCPRLRGPMALEELFRDFAYQQFVVCDIRGDLPEPLPRVPTLFLVGPEGGWAAEEMELFRQPGGRFWRLSPGRLRSETAVVVALALLLTGWEALSSQ